MSDSPSALFFNDRLYCFYQRSGQDGQLRYTSTSDGIDCHLPKTSRYRMSACRPAPALVSGDEDCSSACRRMATAQKLGADASWFGGMRRRRGLFRRGPPGLWQISSLAVCLRERRPASRKDWVTTLSPTETGRACLIPPDSPKTRSSTCALVYANEENCDIDPWPPSLGLYKSVVIALTYMRRNRVQQELAKTYNTSQPTTSRANSRITSRLAVVLAPFVPTAEDLDPDTRYIYDGTLLPCWSWREHRELYSGKRKTTGKNVQVACNLYGELAWISDPVDGSRHDAHCIDESSVRAVPAERRPGQQPHALRRALAVAFGLPCFSGLLVLSAFRLRRRTPTRQRPQPSYSVVSMSSMMPAPDPVWIAEAPGLPRLAPGGAFPGFWRLTIQSALMPVSQDAHGYREVLPSLLIPPVVFWQP